MDLIYSVKLLMENYLQQGEKFIIPSYQRGYKWKKHDIEQLLNDIYDYKIDESGDTFYCLQNITLIKVEDGYNVVDGQQRLTTLALILSYLGETELFRNRIKYNIRTNSHEFLNDYVFSGHLSSFMSNREGMPLIEWENLNIDEQYNYQDIFYMYNACQTIECWFDIEIHKEAKEVIKDKLLNHVKLIVNLPQITSNQEFDLFDNLNGKRVSLDGADLIRAMIITRVAKMKVEVVLDQVKHDVLLNETRIKTGMCLDQIHRWWSDKEKQRYFSHFVSNINSNGENIAFKDDKYPIDILYKLYIQTTKAKKMLNIKDNGIGDKASGTIKLGYFERPNDINGMYEEIYDLQRLIEYWYKDVELYHLVLFANIYLKKNFKCLTDAWSINNRNTFVKWIKEEIRNNDVIKVAIREGKDDELNYNENWYDGDEEDMSFVMVLLDIISIINSQKSKFPIANIDALHFTPQKEDKEHIFPQTPLSQTFTIKTLKAYVDVAFECKYKIRQSKEIIMEMIDHFQNIILGNERFREYFNNKMTREVIPVNSLGNVCLLQDRVNRSYGNDFFTQKHFDIISKSRNGEYIRPHVLDAFSKAMATERQRTDYNYMQKWTKDDIYARRRYIVDTIKKYLE